MYKSIFILLIVSILLLFIGYNFAFNTNKTMSKYISLANYKEDSYLYKLLSSESNILWMKIVGYGILVFALITFIAMVLTILKKF
jgi:type IV secretory pathway component VirB8